MLEATETGSSEFFFLREYFQTTQGHGGRGHVTIQQQSTGQLGTIFFDPKCLLICLVIGTGQFWHPENNAMFAYMETSITVNGHWAQMETSTFPLKPQVSDQRELQQSLLHSQSNREGPVDHQKVKHSPVPLVGNLLMTSHDSKQQCQRIGRAVKLLDKRLLRSGETSLQDPAVRGCNSHPCN